MSAGAPRPDLASVREATHGDARALVDLFVELKEHHKLLQPQNPRYHVERGRWERVVREALDADDKLIFVAEADGDIAGLVKLSFEEKPWGRACEIDTLVVTASQRGRGYGSLLMEEAERVAIDSGAKGLRVDVLAENDAGREFYAQRGYDMFAVRLGKTL